jgi:hypothetical protein
MVASAEDGILALGIHGLKLMTQVAWAAGLFEGEGYFGGDPRNGHVYPHTALSSTDLDVLERFTKIIGVGKIRGPYKTIKGKKPIYRWQVTGAPAARVARMLFPFLLERRQKQISAAMIQYKPKRRVKWL